MSKTRLSALQKAVLHYFIAPDGGGWRISADCGYTDATRCVLRWIAELRGDVGGLFHSRRGGRTSQKLRRSFYRSLQNMEDKGLLVREKRAWSGYTRFVRLTPEGIRLARQVDPRDFEAPFERLGRERKREDEELRALFERVVREVVARERG